MMKKIAYSKLLNNVVGNFEEGNENEEGENISFEERMERFKEHKLNNTDEYGNCDFVFRSAAVVERLWSVGNNILEDKRMRTTPVLFEAILLLRFNHCLWDLSTVRDAIMMVRNDRVQNRLDEVAVEEKLHGDQY